MTTFMTIDQTNFDRMFSENTHISFIAEYTSLKEAIKNSKEAYGLTAYASTELSRAERTLADINTFYVTTDGTIWYKYQNHWNRWEWTGCIHNGAAACVAEMEVEGVKTLVIGKYQYDRNTLRKSGRTWTVSQ